MDRLYERIDFQNEMPPALNADNLNAISKALEELDLRVISIAPEILLLRLKNTGELLENTQTLFEDAEGNAILAKSYAVGGTGSREGDGTDNAKYYKEQAENNAIQAQQSASLAYNFANQAGSYASQAENVVSNKIVNNLLATTPGYILDAMQGKELNDKILTLQENGVGGSIEYYAGTCSTSASTTAKVVTISGFKLKVGAIVHVKFSYTNTSSTATLNVSSTGAKAMYYMNGERMYYIPSGLYHSFIYDGTYWRYLGTQNAIMGARTYEQRGIKMDNFSLVPLVPGHQTNLGTIGNKFSYIYANYLGNSGAPVSDAYIRNLCIEEGGYINRILPALPLVKGDFVLYGIYQVYINHYTGYDKMIFYGHGDSAGCGCGSYGSGASETAVAFLLRIMGYEVTPDAAQMSKPFVEEIMLSTIKMYDCAGEYTNTAIITTPYGNTISITLTGINVSCCGAYGSPKLTIVTSSSQIHFNEIDLIS